MICLPFVISSPSSRTMTSGRKPISDGGPLVELGRLSSTTAMRENTAVISRNGTSTTMRFRNAVILSSTSSLPWSL